MTVESINDPTNKISNALRYITATAQEYFLDPIFMVNFLIVNLCFIKFIIACSSFTL